MNFIRFDLNSSNKWGFTIVLITILTRIFIITPSWNYGLIVHTLRNKYSINSHTEFVIGIAQGLCSLLAPFCYLTLQYFSISTLFISALFTCTLSLLLSSIVSSQSILWLTYSLPYGLSTAIIMILGTLLTGIYFPKSHKYHVFATVLISIGLSIGSLFNILFYNSFNLNYEQQLRLLSLISFIFIIIFGPLFNDKHIYQEYNDDFLPLSNYPENNLHKNKLSKLFWYFGIWFNSIAVYSVVNHFVSLFG